MNDYNRRIKWALLLMLFLLISLVSCKAAEPDAVLPISGMPQGSEGFAWWNDTVFYEIFVRSFYDSDCDGVGDIQGIIEKLDYLNDGDPNTSSDLGITGIWLMPINPSPSYHGYDVTDYYSINPEYGTMEDFEQLLEEAHARGIRVIIDLVVNHSSSKHPWFVDSMSPDSEYRDWYLWQEELPGINWHSSENGYYYALFWSEMPDFNYQNPEMVAEMNAIANFWVGEVGVDGFRIDAAKYIVEEDGMVEHSPGTYSWVEGFAASFEEVNPEALTVGEIWDSSLVAAKYVDDDKYDLAFSFDLANGYVSAASSGNAIQANYPLKQDLEVFPGSQFAVFLSNHDQNRIMSLFNGDVNKARTAAALLLTGPGVPFIYYGEEIGMEGRKPDEFIRTPMQWSDDTDAGFSCGTSWIVPNLTLSKVNVAEQTSDEESLLSWYRELIQIRNQHSALRVGETFIVKTNNSGLYSVLRLSGEEQILIMINLTDEAITDYQLEVDLSSLEPGKYQGLPLHDKNKNIKIKVGENGSFGSFKPIKEILPNSILIYQLAGPN